MKKTRKNRLYGFLRSNGYAVIVMVNVSVKNVFVLIRLICAIRVPLIGGGYLNILQRQPFDGVLREGRNRRLVLYVDILEGEVFE